MGTLSVDSCDVRDQVAVTATVDRIMEQHGRIDGLINNAGGQFPALLEDISLKGWDAVVRTNLCAPFIVSLACFRAWFKDHGGSIVSVLADFWGSMPAMGHSGAARAGTKSFTETTALEWAPAAVRVNAVAPGWIESPGLKTYPESYQAEIARWPSLVPLQRLGTVSEVSAAIVFLLSDAAAFITGTTLRVDGGVPNVRRIGRPEQAGSLRPIQAFRGLSINPAERPVEMSARKTQQVSSAPLTPSRCALREQ